VTSGLRKTKLAGRQIRRALMDGQALGHGFPGCRVRRCQASDRRGCLHHADGAHGQLVVGLLHHEHVGDVAEVVRSLVQVLGLR
jgi:hypothetical protein